jgi:aldose 1-epimerase
MISKKAFGNIHDKEIQLVTLKNLSGTQVSLLNYGAAIQSLLFRDRNGKLDDLVLGFDTIEGYTSDNSYIGAICGRVANRIRNASFFINGVRYIVASNEGLNCLHGGNEGFNRKIWDVEFEKSNGDTSVTFSYTSPSGEEGFPGTLHTKITYSLTEDNELRLNYLAQTDQPTYLNLTNHVYFNLGGAKSPILNHELRINSGQITENDPANLPTGKILDIANTAWDFNSFKTVGRDDTNFGKGYDHNFILSLNSLKQPAAILRDSDTGRMVECYTSEPAIQLYTSNHFDGSQIGKNGTAYQKHYGLCLEAQHYPDSMNQPHFPNTLLLPGQVYTQTTVYHFLTY